MKRFVLVCAVAFFAFISALTAQVNEKEVLTPASQDDVRELQKEIRRLRIEALRAEQNSATRSSEDRQKILDEHKATISSMEKKLADKMASLASIQKAGDDKMRLQIIALLSVGLAIFAVAVFSLGFLRKKTPGVGIPVQDQNQEVGILVDPDVPTLREYMIEHKTNIVPFILTLNDGRQFKCTAELKEAGLPLVRFDGSATPVAWDKRRPAAVKLAEKQVV